MGETEFDPNADLAACQAMADEFEAYLKSDVLYWQMNAARPGGDGRAGSAGGGYPIACISTSGGGESSPAACLLPFSVFTRRPRARCATSRRAGF